jgi:cytosine/creatinine deaminase
MPLNPNHDWLCNVHIPAALVLAPGVDLGLPDADSLLHLDLEISDGKIAAIAKADARWSVGDHRARHAAYTDRQGGLVWPGFVDIHTHLDKGHTWPRAANPDGTFGGALRTVQADAAQHWGPEDLYRRISFGLKCSYAHGTTALRTHLDSAGKQGQISFEVFRQLRDEWADRLTLQAVCLVSLDHYLTPAGEALADLVAESGGVLGGVAYPNPDLEAQIERVFQLAQERGLHLDFHADETDDPESRCLAAIAAATLRHDYIGKVVCGHCCSLAVQPAAEAAATIDLVKAAGIGIISLPMCNLYLQDRVPERTPRWRGITLLHELRAAGVPVAIASDNCRDPFYGFGDHDGLEVFTQAARIAHLDRPYGNWARAIATTPADLMGLETLGRIAIGLPADLVLFTARSFSELLSRGQADRQVLRSGRPIDTTLPAYAELDDLVLLG